MDAATIRCRKVFKERIEYGQTDVEGTKMDAYINGMMSKLEHAITSEVEAKRDGKVLLFWEECKKDLGAVYDASARKPLGSITFPALYRCLVKIQKAVLARPKENWITPKREAPFSDEVPQSKRSKTIPGQQWQCPKLKCQTMNDYGKDRCWKCRTKKPERTEGASMGENSWMLWKDPPTVLYEGKGFWIFFKNAYWVCDTPEDVQDLKSFCPKIDHTNGNLTSWVNAKYAKQHPFLNKYDKVKGINYGLLNRLDRETSGPVVVAKDEETFWKLKKNRNIGDWFKEYTCLVHGRVPLEYDQGVLENYMLTEKTGKMGRTKVLDEEEHGAEWAVTLYQVRSYHTQIEGKKKKWYTLMRVRIITGRRHQIRVHMNHFLKGLGSKIGAEEDFGLVSDFMYLQPDTVKEDKILCDRVFLHASLLGMWDPEDYNRIITVKATMPNDLCDTLGKLNEDEKAKQALRKHREARRSKDKTGIEDFCMKYRLNARERAELQEGWFWKKHSDLCDDMMNAFRYRAGNGLNTLSVDGDHSFLLEGIRKDLEYNGNVERWDFNKILERSLKHHIDDRLWQQQTAHWKPEDNKSASNENLPKGWRQLEVKGVAYYVHEEGFSSKRPPLIDANLPPGWSKFESEDGKAYYTNHLKHRTIWTFPTADDMLPPGWEKLHSRRDPNVVFYLHADSGRTQRGLPCEGSLEDLPPGWEKCASRKDRTAYYFHAASVTTQRDRPLPPGWQVSSRGFRHCDGAITPNTPLYDRKVPDGWTKFESRSQPGVFYYMDNKNPERTQLELPKA